jgi:hypothetical protein
MMASDDVVKEEGTTAAAAAKEATTRLEDEGSPLRAVVQPPRLVLLAA